MCAFRVSILISDDILDDFLLNEDEQKEKSFNYFARGKLPTHHNDANVTTSILILGITSLPSNELSHVFFVSHVFNSVEVTSKCCLKISNHVAVLDKLQKLKQIQITYTPETVNFIQYKVETIVFIWKLLQASKLLQIC